MSLVTLLVLLLHFLHVVGNVLSEDTVTVGLGIVLLGFTIVTNESGLAKERELEKQAKIMCEKYD